MLDVKNEYKVAGLKGVVFKMRANKMNTHKWLASA